MSARTLVIALAVIGTLLFLWVVFDLNPQLPPERRVLRLPGLQPEWREDRMRVRGLAVHHTASPVRTPDGRRVDAAYIEKWHAQRGFQRFKFGRTWHIGYHFVILPDGRIERGRPEDYPGAHANGWPNYSYLGVVLVGYFDAAQPHDEWEWRNRPTSAQLAALTALTRKLQVKYAVPFDRIKRHMDVDGSGTCPGPNFPWNTYRKRVATEWGFPWEPPRESASAGQGSAVTAGKKPAGSLSVPAPSGVPAAVRAGSRP